MDAAVLHRDYDDVGSPLDRFIDNRGPCGASLQEISAEAFVLGTENLLGVVLGIRVLARSKPDAALMRGLARPALKLLD